MSSSSSHGDSPANAPQESLSKFRKIPGSAAQLRLHFDPRSVGYDDTQIVRDALSTAISRSDLSREQIADRMSELLSTRVTVAMLNAFTAETKAFHRWPAAWDRAFCAVVGDNTLLVCRVLRSGYYVITEEEGLLLELGRQYLTQKRAAELAARIERELEEVDL